MRLSWSPTSTAALLTRLIQTGIAAPVVDSAADVVCITYASSTTTQVVPTTTVTKKALLRRQFDDDPTVTVTRRITPTVTVSVTRDPITRTAAVTRLIASVTRDESLVVTRTSITTLGTSTVTGVALTTTISLPQSFVYPTATHTEGWEPPTESDDPWNRAITSIPKPATSIPKPATSVSKPATSISKPAPSVSKPASSVSRPASSIPKPIASPSPRATQAAEINGLTDINKLRLPWVNRPPLYPNHVVCTVKTAKLSAENIQLNDVVIRSPQGDDPWQETVTVTVTARRRTRTVTVTPHTTTTQTVSATQTIIHSVTVSTTQTQSSVPLYTTTPSPVAAYAACQTQNLLSHDDFQHPIHAYRPESDMNLTSAFVHLSTPAQCCQACFNYLPESANATYSTCLGSGFVPSADGVECELRLAITDDEYMCSDGQRYGGENGDINVAGIYWASFYDEGDPEGGNSTIPKGQAVTMSNGPCGAWTFMF